MACRHCASSAGVTNSIAALQVVERLKAIRESGAIAKMDAQEEQDIQQMKQGFCCFGS